MRDGTYRASYTATRQGALCLTLTHVASGARCVFEPLCQPGPVAADRCRVEGWEEEVAAGATGCLRIGCADRYGCLGPPGSCEVSASLSMFAA